MNFYQTGQGRSEMKWVMIFLYHQFHSARRQFDFREKFRNFLEVHIHCMTTSSDYCVALKWIFSIFILFSPFYSLFSAASSDSIRFHSNLLSHDNDLRASIDNTCTDSLVTALDDEALLINDYMNDMSRSKVICKCHWGARVKCFDEWFLSKLTRSSIFPRSILTMCPFMGHRRRRRCQACHHRWINLRQIFSKINYKHGFNRPTIGWPWSSSAAKKHSWKNEYDRKLQAIGWFIRAVPFGKYCYDVRCVCLFEGTNIYTSSTATTPTTTEKLSEKIAKRCVRKQ